MSQKTAVSTTACPPGTLAGGPVRTRFFDGMFLTQADLETEQRYWRLKRRLTNRALGDGVVWGLRLDWKANKRAFALSPGYAIDCCGNDLVVESALELSELQLWSRADPALRSGAEIRTRKTSGALETYDPNAPATNELTVPACIVLQYVECAEEARPVHRDACAGAVDGTCEPSRIRESVRLLLVPPPAKPAPTPPEQFLEDLARWRDSLDPAVRDLLFPPQGTAPLPAAGGMAPVSVRVTVPGTTPSTATVQVPASGSTTPVGPLQAQQPVTGFRPTGVVTFELLPGTGWAFTGGTVTDQGRVVETVTPPAAPSMYWALDVALPTGATQASIEFEALVADVELSQTFGGTKRGRIRAKIQGVATVAVAGASAVTVKVDRLAVATAIAEVAEDAEGQACLRELVPWGWTVDPANGSKIARSLVLASLYAFLSETVSRGSSQAWRTAAQELYAAGWYLLFGANPIANVEAAQRRKLSELVLALYKRWCDGLAYPGPRCSDEHHGVYLGSVEVTPSGAIRSFDLWRHRRQVVTGPLLGHWGRQLGAAPLDVVVGRFARAMCCLAGLPGQALPSFQGGLAPGLGEKDDTFHIGTAATVDQFAKQRGTTVKWFSPAGLSVRLLEAFTLKAGGGEAVDVVATQLPDGGSIAAAVPSERALISGGKGKLHGDLIGTLRQQGPAYVREAGREAAADFAVQVMRAASPATLLDDRAPAATRALAEAVARTGATAEDAAVDGSRAMLVRSGLADTAENREAAADLVEAAEKAVDGVVQATAKVLGPKLDRSALGDAANQKKLAELIAGKLIPKLSAADVAAAADRASKQ